MRFDKTEIENLIDSKIQHAGKKYGKEVKALIVEILSLEKMLNAKEEGRLIPLSLWNNYYDYPTVAGMRMKVFNEDRNGFKDYGVVQRDGKRVLIDEQAYKRWQRRNQAS